MASIVDNFEALGEGLPRTLISDRYSRFADLEMRGGLGGKEAFVTGERKGGLGRGRGSPE